MSSATPNIIFILADDLGYDDLGSTNNIVSTPSINKIYSEGQRLSWYYGQSLCSPTRTAIMTGLYPLHNQINNVIMANASYGVPLNYTFFPKILKQYSNYDTHAIGKWHMGYYKWDYTPTFRGFNSFYGYYNGDEDYYNHSCMQQGYYDFHDDIGINCGENCSRIVTDDQVLGTYSNYLYTSRAIDVIKNNSQTDEPLFLYLAFQSVHGPHEVPGRYIEKFSNRSNNSDYNLYLGMISILDESISNFTNILEKYGYLNNDNGSTIIIFSSDNGAPYCTECGYNTPLRGTKTSVWEGGCRLTGAIWGTEDIVSKNRKGSNYTQLMHVVDWYATLLEASGIDINKLGFNYSFDSVSQWKGIQGGNSGGDEYFEYRDSLWYGYATDIYNRDFVGFNNTAFRYKWYKIINGSGSWDGIHDAGWYKPNLQDLKWIPVYSKEFSSNGNESNEMYRFYNIENDAREYVNLINITNKNNGTFRDVLNKMIALENTMRPQMINDTNCPPFKPKENSIVGKVYMPWC